MVEMKIKNKDGKYIQKKVPEELVSTYENIGWEIVKQNNSLKSKESEPKLKSSETIINRK